MVKTHSVIALLAAALAVAAVPLFHVDFRDIAAACGLSKSNIYGGLASKAYILETTGNGAAIFDFDGDGRNDVLIANGTRLDFSSKEASLPQLYHNDGNGHFTDVSAKAGFTQTGWSQGVCAGDYDNDGHTDMLVTA